MLWYYSYYNIDSCVRVFTDSEIMENLPFNLSHRITAVLCIHGHLLRQVMGMLQYVSYMTQHGISQLERAPTSGPQAT